MHGLAVFGRNVAISPLCNVHLYGFVQAEWYLIRLLFYDNLGTALYFIEKNVNLNPISVHQ